MTCRFLFFLFILPFCTYAYRGEKAVSNSPTLSASLFIENKGQIIDENGRQRTDIDYKIDAGPINIFIGDGQLHYQWKRNRDSTLIISEHNTEVWDFKTEIYRLDVKLIGANTAAELIAEDHDEYFESYYLSYCPAGTVAHSCGKITYKNVYSNIDWVLYLQSSAGNKKILKYDFIVHPGGNPKDIRMQYEGATSLKLKDGSLTAVTPFGAVTEEKPYSYELQNKQELPSGFVLEGDVLSFDLEQQDKTIVIDPVLNWGTYFGNPSPTIHTATTTDIYGNVFIGGYTDHANLATFSTSHQYIYKGNTDAFIAKFNPSGILSWATYYGGPLYDRITKMEGDASGNIYVVGFTFDSTHVFGTTGCHQYSNGGTGLNGQTLIDGFLSKFNTSGQRIWGTYYGGYFNEFVYALACDLAGNVSIGGYTESPTGITTTGSFKSTFTGPILGSSHEGFFARFNPSGVRQWGSYLNADVRAISTDVSLNLYLGGFVVSQVSGLATTGCFQPIYGGGSMDGFVTKFSPAGAQLWGTYYGGTDYDDIWALACDSLNNIYLGGYIKSWSLVAGIPLFSVIAKFDSSGSRRWAAPCLAAISDINISTDGNPLFAGMKPGSTDNDGYLGYFNENGQNKWAVVYNGDYSESNMAVGIGYGKFYLGGATNSPNNIATSGAWQNSYTANPQYVSFLCQFEADTNLFLSRRFYDTLHCIGGSSYIDYHTTNRYGPNNTFTVQLSDATGSFSNPVNIGSRTFDSSGNIAYTIPVNTAPGAGYRLRVISSSPADTTKNNGVNIRISAYPTLSPMAIFPICANGVLKLLDTVTTAPLSTTYKWTGPGAFNVGLKQYDRPNVQVTDSGYYVLTADNFGCIRKDSVHVTVYAKPNKPTFTNNGPLCVGDTLKLVANTSGVTMYNMAFYQGSNPAPVWYRQDASADTTIISSSLSDTGRYVTVALAGGCPSDAETTKVVINPLVIPTVQIGSTPANVGPWTGISYSVTGSSHTGTNPSYQWMKNGADIPGATGATYNTQTTGDLQTGDIICVRLTSKAVCAQPTTAVSCLTLTINLDIKTKGFSADNFKLYPNPTNGNFIVETKSAGVLYISNIHGQAVAEYKLEKGKTNLELPLYLTPGIYTGKFVANGITTSVQRIVLSR